MRVFEIQQYSRRDYRRQRSKLVYLLELENP
jgi:hypothetical protein